MDIILIISLFMYFIMYWAKNKVPQYDTLVAHTYRQLHRVYIYLCCFVYHIVIIWDAVHKAKRITNSVFFWDVYLMKDCICLWYILDIIFSHLVVLC